MYIFTNVQYLTIIKTNHKKNKVFRAPVLIDESNGSTPMCIFNAIHFEKKKANISYVLATNIYVP